MTTKKIFKVVYKDGTRKTLKQEMSIELSINNAYDIVKDSRIARVELITICYNFNKLIDSKRIEYFYNIK